jgi:hypothetical protein
MNQRIRKRIVVLLCAAPAVPLLLLAWHLCAAHSLNSRAAAIQIGDSKADVSRRMGEPDVIFEATTDAGWFSRDHETWAYGGSITLRDAFHSNFPYFFPFKLRLFGPHSDDVAIQFDKSGRVLHIRIPKR